jgi:hypothetical protein
MSPMIATHSGKQGKSEFGGGRGPATYPFIPLLRGLLPSYLSADAGVSENLQ